MFCGFVVYSILKVTKSKAFLPFEVCEFLIYTSAVTEQNVHYIGFGRAT